MTSELRAGSLVWISILILLLVPAPARAQPATPAQSLPNWAQFTFTTTTAARGLKRSTHLPQAQLVGDFDGDGTNDIALLVESIKTHKMGVLFIHHDAKITAHIVGAGTPLGNGGDNFDWADSWRVELHGKKSLNLKVDSIVLEKESSASAQILFVNGKYRWRQLGD